MILARKRGRKGVRSMRQELEAMTGCPLNGAATGNTGNISAHLLHVGGAHPGKERAVDDVGERPTGQNGRDTLRRCTGPRGGAGQLLR